jgi:LmbE family N-acetylglucosaminyl deacetylase
MRVLVFGAHPDDETVGMGGTICKHTRRHDEVMVCCMTDGSGGGLQGYSDPGVTGPELTKIRKSELKAACDLMGVNEIEFGWFEDGFLFLSEESLTKTGNLIRSYKPDRVYLQYGNIPHGYTNLDHIELYRIVTESLYKIRWPNYPKLGKDRWDVKEIYAYTEWGTPTGAPADAFVDISDVIDLKVKAVECHKSQGYWKFAETVKFADRAVGISSGIGEYAESFKTLRTVLL